MNTRNLMLIAFTIFGLMLLTTPAAQSQTCDGSGKNFVDLNGDGFNDNAPDHDGDGIPNGLDPDYVKYAQDGTGRQLGQMHAYKNQTKLQQKVQTRSRTAVRLQAFEGNLFQNRFGAQGGMNGSAVGFGGGFGTGSGGSGICDGTGPHGGQGRGSK